MISPIHNLKDKGARSQWQTVTIEVRELLCQSPETLESFALSKLKKEISTSQTQLASVWNILSTSTNNYQLLKTWFNFREYVSLRFKAGVSFMDACLDHSQLRRLSMIPSVKEELKQFSSEYYQRNPNILAIEWGLAYQLSKESMNKSGLMDDFITPSSYD